MAAKKDKKGSTPKSGLLFAKEAIGKVLKADDPTVEVDPEMVKKTRPHLPTGSIIMDFLIGGRPNRYGVPPCPGLPRGALSNIYGSESSGKTTFALTASAETIRRGGTVGFIDWEHAVDLSYAKALGVPIDDDTKFLLYQPNTLEAGFSIILLLAMAGVDLIVIDSVGAGVPKKFFEKSVDDQGSANEIGLAARLWSEHLAKLVKLVSKTGSHIMGISQQRSKINTIGFGKKTSEQGGTAWKFYSSVRIDFTRIKGEKGRVLNPVENKYEDQYIRSKIKAKMEKTKVSQHQGHELSFWITFGEGIDNVKTIIEVCKNHNVIKKGGAWYSWERSDGSLIKEQGEDSFRKAVESLGLMDELASIAVAKITEASALRHEMVSEPIEEDDLDSKLKSMLNGDVDIDLEMVDKLLDNDKTEEDEDEIDDWEDEE